MRIYEYSWLHLTPFRCYGCGVTNDDEQIGARVRELRREEGLSQAELAELMTDMGVPMQQQTILKIEKGSRSLRMSEAVVMATCLRVTMSSMVPVENQTRVMNELRWLAGESRRPADEAAELLLESESVAAQLQREVDALPEDLRAIVPDFVVETAGKSAEQIFKRHIAVVRQVAAGDQVDG